MPEETIEIQKEFKSKRKEMGFQKKYENFKVEGWSKEELFEKINDKEKELCEKYWKKINASVNGDNNPADSWENVIAKFVDSDTKKLEALKETANFLINKYNFLTFEDSKKIWLFTNPTYEQRGEVKVENELENNLQMYLRNRDINEIVNSIKRKTYKKRNEVEDKERYIALKNGWYDLKEEKLVKPVPEHFIRNEVPIEYDPEADCPQIKQFISEIVEEENIEVIQEIIGYCMYRSYPVSKAFMFLGSGKNGKSTLLNLIEKVIGEKNIANPSLQELLFNQFTKLDLKDKLANIHADLSTEKLKRTGTFKMLTGDDTISGKIKHVQGEVRFKNYAKMLYSANELPPTNDITDAFFRRWIILKFPYKFTEEQNDGHKDKDSSLPDSIMTEEEMSGLFNWALKGLKRVLKNEEFTKTESMEEIKEEWLIRTNPLQIFLKNHVEFKADAEISKSDFRDALNQFSEAHDAKTYKLQTITKELQRKVPGFETTRPKMDGKRVNCYKGLVVKGEYSDYVSHVRGFQNYYDNGQDKGKKSDQLSLINRKTPDTPDMKGKRKKGNGGSVSCGTSQLLEFYPENDPADLTRIKSVAVEDPELDISEEEFDEIHEKLDDNGEIFEPKNGKWKKLN